jgi:hypothetical protein
MKHQTFIQPYWLSLTVIVTNNTQNNTSAHTNSNSSPSSEQDAIINNNNSSHHNNSNTIGNIDNNKSSQHIISNTIDAQRKDDNELVTKLANTASVLLGSFGGNITAVIAALGGKLLAPHINTDVVTRHLVRVTAFMNYNAYSN